jgi:calcium-dependent protein kinase
VLEGDYDERCDVWSAGVLMYLILCGYPPFFGRSDLEIYRQIKKGTFEFPDKEWQHISDDAKDMIRKMICPEHKRARAAEIINHPWLALADTELDASHRSNVPVTHIQNLKTFRAEQKM